MPRLEVAFLVEKTPDIVVIPEKFYGLALKLNALEAERQTHPPQPPPPPRPNPRSTR